ncbi:MAG: acyl--CoA ligase [Acidimicrobiales bacterium]|nr:acyl--CoA ligase [Acidimicrobiales bacterium]
MMLLEMASSGFGDRIAVGTRADGITYTELFDRAGRAASWFRELGVERVSYVDESTVNLPICLFASGWTGLPFVPLNYRLTEEELHRLGSEVSPAITVCQATSVSCMEGVGGMVVVTDDGFASQVDAHQAAEPIWDMDPESIAILLYTSGTTGPPKAAVLRHKHLVSYILMSVEFMGAGEEEATLVSVPPYHVAGMAAILSSVYAGRRIVQLPHFDPGRWVDLARSEGITHAMVVPTMLARIIEHIDATGGEGIPTLRAVSYGGGKMPLPVIERALELFPSCNFVNAYGLTETSSTIALLGPDDHRIAFASDDPAVRRRLTSVGQALPGVEISIRDENGDPVPAGGRGEVWVRGEQVSGEYLGRTSRVTEEGWFPTHDGGSLDADGYLFLEGRLDDIIIRGAENISPGEVEDVLLAHDAVTDAAVIGVPSTQWGEKIVAAIVLHSGRSATEDELKAWCAEHLRSSRTPEVIEVRDELPYNETGKLLRRVLRQELAEAHGDG